MENFAFGNIVLLKFPYSDDFTLKKRPALILLNIGDSDIIVARITTQFVNSQFDVKVKEWKEAGLLQPSFIRLYKIATLEKQLIERKLGKLKDIDLDYVKNILKQLWNI